MRRSPRADAQWAGCDLGDGAQRNRDLARRAGKPLKLALITVARKLPPILNAMLRYGTTCPQASR